MAKRPQALYKEIEECNEQELQQAQTYLLLRMYGMKRTAFLVGIVGAGLSFLLLMSY